MILSGIRFHPGDTKEVDCMKGRMIICLFAHQNLSWNYLEFAKNKEHTAQLVANTIFVDVWRL